MNITQEKIDNQSALLKVKLEPADYGDRYDTALRNYRKQLNLPGFRAGKVPLGMVKNRFGKSLLADELNKMLNETIQSYISEQKLNVLGSPIPSDAHEEAGDWDNPTEFEFVYEMGLAPKLEVSISSKDKFNYYTIQVDDKMLDDHIRDVRARFGELGETDTTAEGDVLRGDFVELDENGEVKPGGIFSEANFRMDGLDEETTKALTGLKVGDAAQVDPRKTIHDKNRLSQTLGIEQEEVDHISPHFRFVLKEVKRIQPAEMNQELFDKVFGEGEVDSEKAFKDRLREDIAKGFVRESDQLFKRDITRQMIEKFNPELPDTFLKKWIRMTNEKPITAEEVERDYEDYRKGLQWQLIFNEMVGNKEIEVSQDEVVDRASQLLAQQYAQYGIPAPEEKELRESAMRILGKEDQARGIYDALYDEKLIAYVKANASVKEKEVSFDDFVTMANN